MNEDDDITVRIPKSFLVAEETEIEHKLAHLLIDGTIFCNDGWWYKKTNKPWAEGATSLHVNCNDVFAWGCADAEDILFSEISGLYEMWKKDPTWGAAIWCIKKRKTRPQKPLEDMIKAAGIWDLDKELSL